MDANLDNVIRIWLSGGWVMIPLVLLAAMLYYTAIQVLLYCYKEGPQGKHLREWPDWIADPSKATGTSGAIIRFTQHGVSSSAQIRGRFEQVTESLLVHVEQRLTLVRMMVAAAPLMGLLGTVIGMLFTFDGISKGAGSDTASRVAEGISQALITTQTGLMIALPGIFMVLVIQRRIKLWRSRIIKLEGMTLSKFNFPS